MRTPLIKLVLAAIAVAGVPASAAPLKAHNDHPLSNAIVLAAASADLSKISATKATLRDLWIGHIFWVRNVVTAALSGDAAAQKAAEAQVVANAKAIAGSIEPFYGAAAKEKLLGLLAGHYGAVKSYLDARIAKDDAKPSQATTMLLSNAAEIAAFLSSANPNLPKDTVEGLLQAHSGHHIAQIQQLQAKDYVAEAKTWGDMTQHMYVIADALGGALAKQFPEKFAAQ
jgi:hypothetical protein